MVVTDDLIQLLTAEVHHKWECSVKASWFSQKSRLNFSDWVQWKISEINEWKCFEINDIDVLDNSRANQIQYFPPERKVFILFQELPLFCADEKSKILHKCWFAGQQNFSCEFHHHHHIRAIFSGKICIYRWQKKISSYVPMFPCSHVFCQAKNSELSLHLWDQLIMLFPLKVKVSHI